MGYLVTNPLLEAVSMELFEKRKKKDNDYVSYCYYLALTSLFDL